MNALVSTDLPKISHLVPLSDQNVQALQISELLPVKDLLELEMQLIVVEEEKRNAIVKQGEDNSNEVICIA